MGMYPEHLVAPMRGELENAGFEGLHTPEAVNAALAKNGTTLVVVNSVCGCAAGAARPGAVESLNNDKKPDHLVTVFAGMDTEATQRARELMLPYPPSSPSMALFKDGELVHIIERRFIEGRPGQLIAASLKAAYNEFC